MNLGTAILKNKKMTTTHNIENITFDANNIILNIDGKEKKILLDDISKKLKSAIDIERQMFKISPSGYGVHWPLIDEDLSIDHILKT